MRPSLVRTSTVGAALLTACASSTGPTVENLAGVYEASVWTVTGGPAPRDLLAEGGAIRVELTPDGAAVSSVEYPPPSTLVAGAAGVWGVRRDSVVLRLEGQPPALLGPYAVLGARLRSRGPASTFPLDPQVYEIVLTRTETP